MTKTSSAVGTFVGRTMIALFGRRTVWRLGRKLYMIARGEVPNVMETNGERALIRSSLRAHAQLCTGASFVAFDVGANKGLWSKAVIEESTAAGVKAIVHAFEPVPAIFDILVSKLPPSSSFLPLRLAMSNKEGTARMRVYEGDGGGDTLNPREDGETIEVSITTVAAYASEIDVPTIHFLKIDAEGHDLEVIRGALPLLKTGQISILQFEYNFRWLFSQSNFFSLFKLLDGLNYYVARVIPTGLEIYRNWSEELDRFFEGNYALVRADLVPHFTHTIGSFSTSEDVFVPSEDNA